MKDIKVVTCFLVFNQQVLLLQRSSQVGSYRGLWAGISGFIEADRSAWDQGLIEIMEETGLPAEALQLLSAGDVLTVEDRTMNTRWLVHPLKWTIQSLEGFRLDWEHDRCQWMDPEAMETLETVPGLRQAWENCHADRNRE